MIALAGCDTAATRLHEYVVRDSAGVDIIENLETTPPSWSLAETPFLEIGRAEGPVEAQLHEVSDAKRIDHDRYLIANDGSYEVREYDARGRLVRSFGGEGEGPGEFRSIDALILAGDTLIAFDRQLRRLSKFSLTGQFLTSTTLEGTGAGLTGLPHRAPDGSFIAGWTISTALTRADSGFAKAGDVVRGQVLLIHHKPSGQIADTLGTFPGNEEALVESGGSAASTRAPFSLGFSLATWEGSVVVGTQERFELRMYNGSVLDRLIRVANPDSLVTPDRFRELVDRLVSQAPTLGLAEFVANTPEPRTTVVPAYGRLLVGSDGRLWVSESAFWYLTARRWHVFDVDGRRIATVELPERFNLMDAGADYVLGVWRDDLDVEHVQAFELSAGL
jgi:hypothetical protein